MMGVLKSWGYYYCSIVAIVAYGAGDFYGWEIFDFASTFDYSAPMTTLSPNEHFFYMRMKPPSYRKYG
jgi:hypothetical protein